MAKRVLQEEVSWIRWKLGVADTRMVSLAVLTLVIGVIALNATVGIQVSEADQGIYEFTIVLAISVVVSSYITEVIVGVLNYLENDGPAR